MGKENSQQKVMLDDFNAIIGNYIRNYHKGRETLEKIDRKRKPVHSKW